MTALSKDSYTQSETKEIFSSSNGSPDSKYNISAYKLPLVDMPLKVMLLETTKQELLETDASPVLRYDFVDEF